MPGITRDNDTAGADIVATAANKQVFANGELISVHNDSVQPHDYGIHNSATMIAGSNQVFIGGILVVKEGDMATCGHVATGSTNVFVG